MDLSKLKVGQSIIAEETEYQKDFKQKLENWEVNSPAELPKAEKPEFFDEVKKENFSTVAANKVMADMDADIAANIQKLGILRANGILKAVIKGLQSFDSPSATSEQVIKKLREAKAIMDDLGHKMTS